MIKKRHPKSLPHQDELWGYDLNDFKAIGLLLQHLTGLTDVNYYKIRQVKCYAHYSQ